MDIRLREVGEDDLEALFAFEQEPEATARSRFPPREHDRFMAHWRANVIRGDGVLVRAVVVDGAIAGSVVTWNEADGRRFLGYWLGRAFWGPRHRHRGVAHVPRRRPEPSPARRSA